MPATRHLVSVPRMMRDRWVIAALAAALYAVYGLTRHQQFYTAGYDLGIFDQAVRAYSRFQTPMVPLKGESFHLLGDHFHPILVVLAPLYWVWDDPRMLILAQAALVASSIPVVWGFVERHVSGRVLPGLLVAGYALSWPLQRMIDFDFHEIAFAVPLLALAVDALDRRDDRRLLLACLPLLLVREDMGMVVAMMGVVRLLGRSPVRSARSLLVPVVLALCGTLTFVLVTTWVLPHFSPTGTFAYWNYPDLGEGPLEAISFMLRHPLSTLKLLFVPAVKSLTWSFLLVPLLLLPLRSLYTLIVLPLVAQRFLSSRTYLWTTEYHYSAPIQVVLFLAAVAVIGRLRRPWRHRLAWALVGAQVVTFVADLVMVGTGSVLKGSNYPLYRLVGPAWQRSDHMRDQRTILAQVPAGTCVEVDDRLAPHLTRTNRVTLPTLSTQPSDFIVLDLTQSVVSDKLPSPQAVKAEATARGYTAVSREGQTVLLQHPGYRGPRPECAPTAP